MSFLGAAQQVERRHFRPTIRVWCSHRLRTLSKRSQHESQPSAPSGAKTTTPPQGRSTSCLTREAIYVLDPPRERNAAHRDGSAPEW